MVPRKAKPRPGRARRPLFAAAGALFCVLGAVGVVVPVLPTTPFILLASVCFARSSNRMYRWLFTNGVFGEYLRRYRDGEGLPLPFKIATLTLLWTMLAVSAFFFVPTRLWWIRILLLAVGTGVTIHILRVKTSRG
jgi:uncharacterized membrane protein YbaN (DUF454 family)